MGYSEVRWCQVIGQLIPYCHVLTDIYQQVLCHICGVSFNIGRIRKAGEPRTAAWSRLGPIARDSLLDHATYREQIETSFVTQENNVRRARCKKSSGCMYAVRDLNEQKASLFSHTDDSALLASEYGSEMGDSDWNPENEEEEDEPLEYDSELDEDLVPMDADAVMETDEKAENIDGGLTEDRIRDFWLDCTTYSKESLRSLVGERDELSDGTRGLPSWYRGMPYHMRHGLSLQHNKIIDEFLPVWPHPHDIGQAHEHIAGPNCQCLDGYSGFEISAEEMRGCQTVQCLVRKDLQSEDYTTTSDPERNDEEFELKGRFILSGLADYMPSADSGDPKFSPRRHSCQRAYTTNAYWNEDSLQEYAMPFHPTCLEVYKHASKLVTGRIDINALTSWWSLEADYHLFHRFPRDPNIYRCSEQEWQHRQGTSYLAANPLYIPKLRRIFDSAIETDPNFDPQNAVFTSTTPTSGQYAQDPFASLPNELKFNIIDYLSIQDFASLCLASRTFLNFSNINFQERLLRDMPWLWEAWPTAQNPTQTKYSIWAALTPANAAEVTSKPDRDIAAARHYVDIVSEDFPELAQQLEEALPAHIDAIEETYTRETINGEECIPFFLPPDRTNYFKLYMRIARHWDDLLGLRNRARIWEDCEVIIQRADAHRRNGRFDDDGVTETLEDIMHGNEQAERRRVEEEKRRLEEHRNAGYTSIQWVT